MARSRALHWLGLALGVFVLGLVVYRIHAQRQSLDFSMAQVRWFPLGLSILFYFAAQAMFAGSWHRLVSGRDGSGELVGDFARWCVSIAGKYFPGKVWHGLARVGLYHGAHRSPRVAPAFIRETCLSLSAAMTVVAVHGLLKGSGPGWLELGFAMGAVSLLLLSLPDIARIALGWLARWSPLRLAVPDGSLGELALVWLMQVFGYVLFGLGLLALAKGLGIEQAGMAWPMIAALSFAGLAGIAAFFVPAGIGVREAALAWFLSPIIGPAPAALLAVMSRLWISAGEAVLVAGGLLALRNRNGRRAAGA